MFNHNRGLWGYTGRADGEPLTIQSTGMGGPSAAIVVEELPPWAAPRGARRACGALDGALRAGELVAATEVIAPTAPAGPWAPASASSPTPR